jgi:hypothetical protein
VSNHPSAPDPHPAITLISGGQTGADRAALDYALATKLPHAGWCPKGRLAEDGPIPARYILRETHSANYLQRTEWNVRDSDATVVFTVSPRLTGGTKRTVQFAAKHAKPCLVLHLDMTPEEAASALTFWLAEHHVRRLNVAGSRASKAPVIGKFTTRVLTLAFAQLNGASATTSAISPTTPSPPAQPA